MSDAPRTTAGYVIDSEYYSAMMLDAMETVPALTWPESVSTYGKMRFDPQIQAVLNAYTLPLRSATWAVNPRGCRDEAVQLVADGFGLPILGDNDGPGPFRRRGVLWNEHLRLALLMLVYGHYPFAVRFDITGTPLRARLAELSERLPSTIADIRVRDDGTLDYIQQTGGPKAPKIRAKQLLWYAHEKEGAAWQGRSMLRAAYGPWLIKHEMWRVLATSSRRFGMGVPNVEAPPGATQTDIDKAAELAQQTRVSDQGGAGMPHGFRFNLTGLTGSTPDTLGFVRYLDQQIAQSVLASVLNLDASPNGSRALGDTMIGLLQMAWAATAEEITVPASRLAVDIIDYNFGDDEPVPGIVCMDINRPEVTSEALAALMAAGAITRDLGLENTVRERYRLPLLEQRAAPITPNPSASPDNAPSTEPPGTPGRAPEPTPVPAVAR